MVLLSNAINQANFNITSDLNLGLSISVFIFTSNIVVSFPNVVTDAHFRT